MADPVSATLMVAGVGLQAYSSIQASQSKARAAREDAKNKELQAQQVELNTQREEGLLRIRGQRAMSDVETSFQGVGGSAVLVNMEDTARQINSESMAIEQAGAFRADQLRKSATSENTLAGETETAGYLEAATDVLGGAAKSYSALTPNNGKTMSVGQRRPAAFDPALDGGI